MSNPPPSGNGGAWAALTPEEIESLNFHKTERGVFVLPNMVRALRGNGNFAIYLSQLLFRSRKTDGQGGWFYASEAQLEKMTGIGRKGQRNARALLVSLGLIETKRQGTPARMYFSLDLKRIAALLREDTPVVSHGTQLEGSHGNPSDVSHGNPPVGSHGSPIVVPHEAQHSIKKKKKRSIKEEEKNFLEQEAPPWEEKSVIYLDDHRPSPPQKKQATSRKGPRSEESLRLSAFLVSEQQRIFPDIPPRTEEGKRTDAYWFDLLHQTGYGGRTFSWEELQALTDWSQKHAFWHGRIGSGRDIWSNLRQLLRQFPKALQRPQEADIRHNPGPSGFRPLAPWLEGGAHEG